MEEAEAEADSTAPDNGDISPVSASEVTVIPVLEEPQPTEGEEKKEEVAAEAAGEGEPAGEAPAAAEEAGEAAAEKPPPEEGEGETAAASEAPPGEEEAKETGAEDEKGGESEAEDEAGAASEGEAEAAGEAVAEAPEAEAGAAPEGKPEAEEAAPSLPELQLPSSRFFSLGEAEEPSPLQVGVPLGRRISQSLRELEGGLSLSPGRSLASSESLEEETEEQIEAKKAEEMRQKMLLAEEYCQLVVDRSRLRRYNSKLQCKLAELMNKAKPKERARAELEQHISDKEQRYSRYLAMLQDLRTQQEEELAWYQKQINTLRQNSEEKLAKVDAQWKAYWAVKREVAVFTMGKRLGGKQAAIKQVEQIQNRELSKEKEVTEVRLENIKLKHRILKLEASLKAQEELAEGLHLIDFEQLKIENQTYNEKIEERNEELQKLQRKITNTVQILTQVKEKLQFVEGKNQSQKAELHAVEALVAQKRDLLTRTKQIRDRLRIDNEKLHQKCGLLGNRLLLRDFENKTDASEILAKKLEKLKHQHAGLTLACQGVKKKIKAAKTFLPL